MRSPAACVRARNAPKSTPMIRPPSTRAIPSTMTVSTSSPIPHSTRLLIGSRTGPIRRLPRPERSMTTMSALAPGASRPRSSRPSERAPPKVAASNTSAAEAAARSSARNLAEIGGDPHLHDHVARVGVGAERDVDASLAVALPGIEKARPPRDVDRAVRHGAAVRSHDLEIAAAGIVHQRVLGDEIAVPNIERTRHQPDLFEQLD